MRKLSEELTELGLIERKDHETAIKLADKNSDRQLTQIIFFITCFTKKVLFVLIYSKVANVSS